MSALTKLDRIEAALGDELRTLQSAHFVLRAFFDPSWLDFSDKIATKRLLTHAKAMFSDVAPGCPPPLVRALASIDNDAFSPDQAVEELRLLVPKQLLIRRQRPLSKRLRKFQRSRDEQAFRTVGERWTEIRAAFEEFCARQLPPRFRERMAHGTDMIREVWAVWFRPASKAARKELTGSVLAEVQEKGGWPATSLEQLIRFLPDPLMRPCWPDVNSAIRKLKRVCKTCREEGLVDFSVTDEELRGAALQIVRKLEPDGAAEDPLLDDRLLADDLYIPDALKAKHLPYRIIREFEPLSVSVRAVRDVIHALAEEGRLHRRIICGELYYMATAPPSAEDPVIPQTPRWNAELRELTYGNRPIKSYRKHSAKNQTTILAAFEERKWPPRIDDPCKPGKLRQTISDLNRNVQPGGLRFSTDGTGEGVLWRITEAKPS